MGVTMKKRIIGYGVAAASMVAGLLWFGTQSVGQDTEFSVAAPKSPIDSTLTARPALAVAPTSVDAPAPAWAVKADQAAPVVLDERQRVQEDGSIRKDTLVRTTAKYPARLIRETLRKDRDLKSFIPSGRTEMVADQVLVSLRPDTPDNALDELLREHGASVIKILSDERTFLIQLSAPSMDAVELAIAFFEDASAEVAYAEPNYIRRFSKIPNDLMYGDLWGMNKIDAPLAWNITTGSSNVVVAVIDTGMDMDHPDLLSNLWKNDAEVPGDGLDNDGNGYVDDVHGWDFGNDDKDPEDGHGHGTHCAGTIGGVGNNANQVVGVCWNVSIMPVKATLNDGEFNAETYSSDITDSIRYAVRNGAKVLSNSYGGGGYSQTESDAIEYANDEDVIFVAAAGNDASDNDSTAVYPASYDCPNII
jgi:hypothetical protein